MLFLLFYIISIFFNDICKPVCSTTSFNTLICSVAVSKLSPVKAKQRISMPFFNAAYCCNSHICRYVKHGITVDGVIHLLAIFICVFALQLINLFWNFLGIAQVCVQLAVLEWLAKGSCMLLEVVKCYCSCSHLLYFVSCVHNISNIFLIKNFLSFGSSSFSYMCMTEHIKFILNISLLLVNY